LFSWVIENLCKNAIDAIGNDGKITIDLKEKTEQVFIDITDIGLGIAKSQFKTIFQLKKEVGDLAFHWQKELLKSITVAKYLSNLLRLGKALLFGLC
jgi:LytS/YehU family sensor histidine kinase